MSADLVVATRNKKKLMEIRGLLADLDFNVLSIEDFDSIPEIHEDGSTFEENARKKAVQVARITKRLTLADDSGLEIDHLGGEPGVRSARFAGENATDQDRNRKILDLLKGVPRHKRKARFTCAIAVANPDVRDGLGKISALPEVEIAIGVCQGEIAFEPRGNKGFGYDPIFIVPAYNKTFAELGQEKKNQISHRALALKRAKDLLGAHQT
jgi:XTP/dITP diphosphohydrolase